MSTATKVAPIVVAGFAGILVGWMLSPDIDAVRDDFAARFNEQTPLVQQLQASVAEIQARIGTLPDAATLNASIQEQLTATEGRIATQTDSIASRFTEQAGTAPDGVTTGIEDVRSEVETLSGEVAALREEIGAASATAEPAEDAAGQLASQIGAEGAVLLPGQGAIFGGSRIDLSAIDVEGATATMTPEGGQEAIVAEGDTVQLSETCTITLAGIASNAAYLAPEDCSEPAAEPVGAPAEEAAPAPAAAEAPEAEAPEDEAPAEPAAEDQPAPAEPTPAEGEEPAVGVPAEEGAQAVPDQQPGQAEENAPNAGEPQGGQSQTTPAQ